MDDDQLQNDDNVVASEITEPDVKLEDAVDEDSEEYEYFKAANTVAARQTVGRALGASKHAFIPLSKAYRFAALYLTPEQIKQAAMWKRPAGWPSFVPWCASIVKACQMWLNPNIGAAMEIADRTEGKVKQTLEVENRGVVALPLIQITNAEEWRGMFSPVAPAKELPPVTVEIINNQSTDASVKHPKARSRKHPKNDS